MEKKGPKNYKQAKKKISLKNEKIKKVIKKKKM
jgi:hypothetical protein